MPDTVTHYFRYTTDDVSDTTPSWTDATDLVRSFSISRGRENELADVDAGTAQVVLDNRGRDFDPVANPLIRPMNRWWLQVVHPGGTDDLFFGYAESYQQEWPGAGGRDAVCVVHLVDEFKVLALDHLPTTDPPRDTYQDLVMFDTPVAYWPMTYEDGRALPAVTGPPLDAPNGLSFAVEALDAPIIGQAPAGYTILQTTNYFRTQDIEAVDIMDPGGLSELTYELWFKYTGLPSAQEWIYRGPSTNGGTSWALQLETTGALTATVRNSGGTSFVNNSSALTADTWYHIVATITGATFRLYVDGTQVDSVAFSGSFSSITTPATLTMGNLGSTIGASKFRYFDEVAFYRYGLPAARVTAHYEAGTARGLAAGVDPGDRIDDILTAAGNTAARSLRTGTREMIGSYMTGQSPLDEIRKAEHAENVDAVFFIAGDGTAVFLDDGHRSVSPWNTVQATFDDDGTDLPYLSVAVDYSESFLANEINVTRVAGTTTTSTDAASIADFFKRTMSLTELPIWDDTDVSAIAAALLAKYKDPMTRVTGLLLTTGHDGIAAAVFPLEIGDRIRVLRTPPHGGGSRIDQTVFIQKIQVSGAAQSPYWNITLNVSPL